MKKILIIAAILLAAFLLIPEDSKTDIAFHAKTENYNPRLAKFLIGTKVGRKVSYIFVRKKTKKELRKMKKEVEKYLKELEEEF